MSTSLGEKIRKHRKERGFSLEKLGQLTETSKSYIWGLENKTLINPTLDKLERISSALGLLPEYFISDYELSTITLEKAFFWKFNRLSERDKKRIKQIIELWMEDNERKTTDNA